jgi:hypothetical protein
MMQKQPDARFQTADQVLAALENIHLAQKKVDQILNSRETAIKELYSDSRLKRIASIAIPIILLIVLKALIDTHSHQAKPATHPSPLSTANKHHSVHHKLL